jgi:hypothetical protein
MKYLRLVGIALLAICAISAIVASTASAAKITYSGNGRFSITSGEGKLEAVGGTTITCTGDAGTGQLGGNGKSGGSTSATALTAELTISFKGCLLLGKKCTSTGATAGLIDTVKLLATLGDVKAKEIGGALLKPVTGTQFLTGVKCGETEFAVKGSVIGAFTNLAGGTTGVLDVQTNLLNLLFALKSGEKGKQAVTKFVNEEKTNVLEATIEGVTEVAGLQSFESLLLLEGSGQLLA